ncbi:MAG: vWA domain-containing protein [Pirellulaceae bacterium]
MDGQQTSRCSRSRRLNTGQRLLFGRAGWLVVASIALLVGVVGCEPPGRTAAERDNESEDRTRLKPAARVESSDRMKPAERSGRSVFEVVDVKSDGDLSARAAAEMAWRAVEDSRGYGETLVVWMFDDSPGARSLVSEVSDYIANRYERDRIVEGRQPLRTAVGQFSETVTWHLEEPTTENSKAAEAIRSVSSSGSEREVTFAAVAECIDHFKTTRLKFGVKTLFVLVTDETGDDWEMVDDLVGKVSRYQMPVYVIGSPAPFGYRYYGEDRDKQYGPESRGLEMIKLSNWGGDVAMDVVDSGFGPFALEWLCRESGGVFMSVRPEGGRFVGAVGSSWPNGASVRFPKDTMVRYAPDYVSAEKYQQLLASNKAISALAAAAKIGRQEMMSYPQLNFKSQNEAALARSLTEAQKSAARLGPQVNRMYDTLKEGQRHRDDITSPRWQAAFDLSFGRSCAAKVRVNGYNSMLAALKRGMTFEDPNSTMWVLESDNTISVATSLQNLSDRARLLLQRVIDEHPNTPWAMMADRELQTPIGWKWTER